TMSLTPFGPCLSCAQIQFTFEECYGRDQDASSSCSSRSHYSPVGKTFRTAEQGSAFATKGDRTPHYRDRDPSSLHRLLLLRSHPGCRKRARGRAENAAGRDN